MAKDVRTREEFARRLYQAMIKKGWTQAELARRASVLRDSISNYMRGNNIPGNQNVQKLAMALGVNPVDLLPNVIESSIDHDTPSLEMKVSTSDPTRAWLRINRLVMTSTAAGIITLLEADNAAHRK